MNEHSHHHGDHGASPDAASAIDPVCGMQVQKSADGGEQLVGILQLRAMADAFELAVPGAYNAIGQFARHRRMAEIQQLHKVVEPVETLFVVDSEKRLLGTVALAVVTIGVVFVVGLRTKSPTVLRAIRRMIRMTPTRHAAPMDT